MGLVRSDEMNPSKTKEVVRFMHEWGGIEYAKNRMNGLRDEALRLLSHFPENACRTSLADLVAFTVDRSR
jgi:octaprenyl-diphosphate synthase